MHRRICALNTCALSLCSLIFGAALLASPAHAQEAPAASIALATVTISQTVLAGGTALAPGTYQIRLTGEALAPLPGQSPDAEQRVEFVSKGMAVAREVATIYEPEAGAVGTSGNGQGAARVQLLKGGDFLRVSVVRNGTRYLIHLPVAP